MTENEFVEDVDKILRKTIPVELHDRLQPKPEFAPSIVEFNAINQLLTLFVELVGTMKIESDYMLYSLWTIVKAYTMRIPKLTPEEIKAESEKFTDVIKNYKSTLSDDPLPKLPGMYL